MKKTYSGILCEHVSGEADDVLFLSSIKEPFANFLSEFNGKRISVRYWISDKPMDIDEAETETAKQCLGLVNANFWHRYSELTGYLWTDEDGFIGGHDLIKELKGSIGKWLLLEIEVHK